MKRISSFVAAAAIAFAAFGPAPARAASRSETKAGRELMKRYADAIVSVELVVTLKVKMGARDLPAREHRVDVNGTVISADGLTVTSLAEVDPESSFEALRASNPALSRLELLGADFKEVKLRLADGTELPAKFVLKDADLDLAFMAPDEAAAKRAFAHVDLAQAASGGPLDEFFLVSRAPKALQRVPTVRTTEIAGVVEKPRPFFLMTSETPGSPVFDAKGHVLGITVQHFAGGRRTGFVVLPSADIADTAKQATAAKTDEGEKKKP